MTAKNEREMVDHPAHYNNGSIECIDALKSALGIEQYIGFLRGNAIKYLWRCGHKDHPLQEVKKAIWYADKLEEVFKGES